MKITVFTPTYNRAYIIENLYRSLQRQTCLDFEWLVVDDGSTDDTEALFAEWVAEEKRFPIRYYKKENGGKCRAINFAVPRASGELFFIVDSDDYITDDAIKWVVDCASSLPKNGKYAGVCGIKADLNGNDLGKSFFGEYIDCTSLERSQYGIEGDKAEIFYTGIMREYPFPEFENEKFLTEAVVWDRIAADGYLLRFTNQIIYIAEYRNDGLTKQGLELYYQNPRGYALYLNRSRSYRKFSSGVQQYFDVEYYLNCRNVMSLTEMADQLGTQPAKLLAQVAMYKLRSFAGEIKRRILTNKPR